MKPQWVSLTFEDTRRLLRANMCGKAEVSIYSSASIIRASFRPEEKLYCVQTDFSLNNYEHDVKVMEQMAFSGQPALLYMYGSYVDRNMLEPIILPPIVEELFGISVLVAGYSAYYYWLEMGKELAKLPIVRVKHVLMRPVPEATTPIPMINDRYTYAEKTDWEPVERGERRQLIQAR